MIEKGSARQEAIIRAWAKAIHQLETAIDEEEAEEIIRNSVSDAMDETDSTLQQMDTLDLSAPEKSWFVGKIVSDVCHVLQDRFTVSDISRVRDELIAVYGQFPEST